MPKIKDIRAHKIIDSRGEWTVKTTVELDDGSVGSQAVPNGASRGENEAIHLPAERSVDVVNTVLRDALVGDDPYNQSAVDREMIKMDGSYNKHNLGGNSILSVSLAVAQASAKSKGLELYEYLSELYLGTVIKKSDITFPTPVFNIMNGGKHADSGLSFQEFMIIPSSAIPFNERVEIGVKVYDNLKDRLQMLGYAIAVGDEGGFAPKGLTIPEALDIIKEAVSESYILGKDVFFGMDVAAESFFKDGKYNIAEENLSLTPEELVDYHRKIIENYPVIFFEDAFYEKDIAGWRLAYENFADKLLIVADDLVVTNPKFLKIAIDEKLANSVIVKPNQVGNLTETLEFIKMAREAKMALCISHRSGDTAEDTFIADLAIGVKAEFMKSGALARGERVVKYNRLLDIFNSVRS